ncbi:hypothetical protein EVAR_55214_1 [Eumeta japonica]|uniref:Uncharacterized protein n=1 Tax=Eumeta variegata TaxID=151549 RepID=A0A4C1ZM11_EUMVA|nr:hypothetical protein EVAR_55214_1 [Eumeta japonica]
MRMSKARGHRDRGKLKAQRDTERAACTGRARVGRVWNPGSDQWLHGTHTWVDDNINEPNLKKNCDTPRAPTVVKT